MHDDIMHDGIWCINTLPFRYTTIFKKNYQYSLGDWLYPIPCRRYLVTITSTSTSIIKYHYRQMYNFSTWHSPHTWTMWAGLKERRGFGSCFKKRERERTFSYYPMHQVQTNFSPKYRVPRTLPTPNSSIIGTSSSTSWVWIT